MSRSATSTRFLNPSRDGDSTTALGSLVQCLATLAVKTFFLISNLNLPWCNLRPLPLFLLLVTWEKRPTPHLTTTSFQGAVESDKVSPQPPLLQTEQPQLPQPLLSRLVLQTPPQPRCPSLDTLQPLHVLLVASGPELNTALEVRPLGCSQCMWHILTIPYRTRLVLSKQCLLSRYLNLNLTIAFQLRQHVKCLRFHRHPGLPFCPCTEQLQDVNVLLSCWLAQRSPQELLLDVADTFKLLTKFWVPFLSKTKRGRSHFCFMSWHSSQGLPGMSWPRAALSLAGADSELPSRRSPGHPPSLLPVALRLPPFLLKAAGYCKARAYLGPTLSSRPAFRPSCLKQDFGFHSQGQALMNWILNSPVMWCSSPSLQLVQCGKVKFWSQLKSLQWEIITVMVWAEGRRSFFSILHPRKKRNPKPTLLHLMPRRFYKQNIL